MIDTFPGIEAELLQLFRDPAGFAAGNLGVADGDELMAAAERHGVAALLAARCADAPPSPFLDRLRASARGDAVWELGHRRALLDALSALAAAGVEPVLFKGTALAYSLYPNPVLRTRGDTDLIVPQHERERVTAVLQSRGFSPVDATASYQTCFAHRGPDGAQEIDVHWKINNSEVLSRLFTYQELRAEAVSLPGLAPDALAASPVHALLLACMHRGAHRHNPYYVSGEPQTGGDLLIWLYDLHLLAESFGERDWRSFIARAERRVCAQSARMAWRRRTNALRRTSPNTHSWRLNAMMSGNRSRTILVRVRRASYGWTIGRCPESDARRATCVTWCSRPPSSCGASLPTRVGNGSRGCMYVELPPVPGGGCMAG